MTSPFPGMDPYLEGYLWPDVHHELASAIRSLLAPRLAPKYLARIELYTAEDSSPESEIGIMYPDVEVLMRQTGIKEPEIVYENATATDTPTIVIPTNMTLPVRIPVVEIRDTAKNRLITAIEILSPVNKKQPGLDQYREKRMDLHRAGVHVLEIDLIRRGTRALLPPMIPKAHYLATLMRAGTQRTEVWAIGIRDMLPVLPVPLVEPDPDVPLELRRALDMIYERGIYELSIDYKKEPPPPEFGETDRAWMRALLQNQA